MLTEKNLYTACEGVYDLLQIRHDPFLLRIFSNSFLTKLSNIERYITRDTERSLNIPKLEQIKVSSVGHTHNPATFCKELAK
jgi:hypothetical protein